MRISLFASIFFILATIVTVYAWTVHGWKWGVFAAGIGLFGVGGEDSPAASIWVKVKSWLDEDDDGGWFGGLFGGDGGDDGGD